MEILSKFVAMSEYTSFNEKVSHMNWAGIILVECQIVKSNSN